MASSSVLVLDNNYLAFSFIISLAIQLLAFVISYCLQFDKITDFSGGTNFFLLAFLTLILGQSFQARNWIVSLAVMIWASRLAGFLLFRVLKRGKDDRFNDMRRHFFRFGAFWLFQLLWVWIVSLPVIVLNSPNLSFSPSPSNSSPSTIDPRLKNFRFASDGFGLTFWLIGFIIESLADHQKFQFKSRPLDENHTDQNHLPVCQGGVWSWCRHPNYFGEILLWWGTWLMAIGSARNAAVPEASRRLLYATILSPIFVTLLLLFFSGLPTAEKPVQESVFIKSYTCNKLAAKKITRVDRYAHQSEAEPEGHPHEERRWKLLEEYLNQTSILIPIPKSLYRKLPMSVKRTFLMDWSIYRFDPNSSRAHDLIQQVDRNLAQDGA